MRKGGALVAAAWLVGYGLAAVAGAWLAYHAIALTVRAWLWLLMLALPYWLAVVPALALAAATLYALWRGLLWVLPQSRNNAREL